MDLHLSHVSNYKTIYSNDGQFFFFAFKGFRIALVNRSNSLHKSCPLSSSLLHSFLKPLKSKSWILIRHDLVQFFSEVFSMAHVPFHSKLWMSTFHNQLSICINSSFLSTLPCNQLRDNYKYKVQ